jgi:hypothetical protein
MERPIRVPTALELASPGLTLENFRKNYATCLAPLDRQAMVRQNRIAVTLIWLISNHND